MLADEEIVHPIKHTALATIGQHLKTKRMRMMGPTEND